MKAQSSANGISTPFRGAKLDRIKVNFTESIQTKIAAAEALPNDIQTAAQMLTICLLNGNKILACGSGPGVHWRSYLSANWFIASRLSVPPCRRWH